MKSIPQTDYYRNFFTTESPKCRIYTRATAIVLGIKRYEDIKYYIFS